MRIVLITSVNNVVVTELLNLSFNVVGIVQATNNNTSSLSKSFVSFLAGKIDLKHIASKHSLAFFKLAKENQEDLVRWLENLQPDVIVVYSISYLLKESVLKTARFGTINLHLADLPNYRGPQPVFWTYYDMNLTQGVTVHFLDKNEDTGDIIKQEKFEIELGAPYYETINKGQAIGARLIVEALQDIQNGAVNQIKQPKESPTIRAKRIKKVEIKKLINWNEWPVERVFHFLKGTSAMAQPINPPHTFGLKGSWKVESFEHCDKPKTNIGELVKINKGYRLICKDGFINLKSSFNFREVVKLNFL